MKHDGDLARLGVRAKFRGDRDDPTDQIFVDQEVIRGDRLAEPVEGDLGRRRQMGNVHGLAL